jgi:hypothetical protein
MNPLRKRAAPDSSQPNKKNKLDARAILSGFTSNTNGGQRSSTHPSTARVQVDREMKRKGMSKLFVLSRCSIPSPRKSCTQGSSG